MSQSLHFWINKYYTCQNITIFCSSFTMIWKTFLKAKQFQCTNSFMTLSGVSIIQNVWPFANSFTPLKSNGDLFLFRQIFFKCSTNQIRQCHVTFWDQPIGSLKIDVILKLLVFKAKRAPYHTPSSFAMCRI